MSSIPEEPAFRRDATVPGTDVLTTVQIVSNDPELRQRIADSVSVDPSVAVVASHSIAAALGHGMGSHAAAVVIAHADCSEGVRDLLELAESRDEPYFVLLVSGDRPPRIAASSTRVDHLQTMAPAAIGEAMSALVSAIPAGPIDREGVLTTRSEVQERETRLLEALSPRECEVLEHLARGLSVKEVARQLHRSVSTVAKHRDNVMKKLDLHDRVSLARFAIRVGLIEP